MPMSVPYLATPGSLKNALEKIRQAATPDRVTGDFVATKIGIKGGAGRALIPFFKKIGLVNSDGTPSELYKQFRNQTSGGAAIAAAIKIGYQQLASVNEYFHELSDNELKALVVQVTGLTSDSTVLRQIVSTFKILKSFADFDASVPAPRAEPTGTETSAAGASQSLSRQGPAGLGFSYTINLNLPATSDQAVFNAIFRSLREHILSNAE